MENLLPWILDFGPVRLAGVAAVVFFAGFTKGALGFALPMITISGVGSLVSVEFALVCVIIPSLITNIWQAFRNGWAAALASWQRFWRLFLALGAMIFVSAQLITIISERDLFVVLGLMVTLFAAVQIVGFRPHIPTRWQRPAEPVIGAVAGFFGGLSGVWGPPVTLYLIGRGLPKTEMVRVMGLAFLIGSLVLLPAHLKSGVMNAGTFPVSVAMVLPAILGMWFGYRVQDRLDQGRFLRLTLAVLVLAGLNLLRRGLV